MPTADEFLAAILDAPDDDARRLVFADWLEENGDCDRSEFIRKQIEMANLQAEAPRVGPPQSNDWLPVAARRVADLYRRSAALLERHGREWLPRINGLSVYKSTTGARLSSLGYSVGNDLGGMMPVDFIGGFVGRVTLTAEQLIGRRCERCGGTGDIEQYEGAMPDAVCPVCHGTGYAVPALGPLIRRVAPVREWILSDKQPVLRGGSNQRTFGFERQGDRYGHHEGCLPAELWDSPYISCDSLSSTRSRESRRFETAEAARAALAAACRAWCDPIAWPAPSVSTPANLSRRVEPPPPASAPAASPRD